MDSPRYWNKRRGAVGYCRRFRPGFRYTTCGCPGRYRPRPPKLRRSCRRFDGAASLPNSMPATWRADNAAASRRAESSRVSARQASCSLSLPTQLPGSAPAHSYSSTSHDSGLRHWEHRDHCSLFDGAMVGPHWRLTTNLPRTPDEYVLLLRSLFQAAGVDITSIAGSAICSVVPATTQTLSHACLESFGRAPVIVDARSALPIKLEVDEP